jgi:predicted ATP-dependent endonuclease of OLD family
MKISQIKIHNYRSITNATIEAQGYLMLVGANNSGKSNVINALRAFYDELKWSNDDFPKVGAKDEDSWIELIFELSDDEWTGLADKYKKGETQNVLVVRRYFKGIKAKASLSNIYAVIDGEEEDELFYGAKNVSTAKVGNVIYIPAMTTPNEQIKTSGPSPLRNMLNFMLKKVVENSEAYSRIETHSKI